MVQYFPWNGRKHYGTSFTKLAFEDGSNLGTVVAIQTFAAVVLLSGYLLIKGGAVRLPASIMFAAVIGTLSAAAMDYSFISAAFHLDISLTILIVYAHPFFVAIYFHFTGDSRLSVFRIFWAVLAFIGLGMAVAVSFDTVSGLGIGLAFVAAFFGTVLVISIVRVNEHVGGIVTIFHMAFWSLLIFLTALLITQDVQLPLSTLGWASSIGNGIAYVAAYATFLAAVQLIGASRATMFTFMEPVATIILAAALFGERLSQLQWIGVVLVAMGLFFMKIRFKNRSQTSDLL